MTASPEPPVEGALEVEKAYVHYLMTIPGVNEAVAQRTLEAERGTGGVAFKRFTAGFAAARSAPTRVEERVSDDGKCRWCGQPFLAALKQRRVDEEELAELEAALRIARHALRWHDDQEGLSFPCDGEGDAGTEPMAGWIGADFTAFVTRVLAPSPEEGGA